MSARGASLAALALAASLVAGCGGGGGGSATSTGERSKGSGEKLSLKAAPGSQLRYDKRTLRASAGEVTIVMTNPSALSHSVAIEGNGVSKAGQVVAPGGTSRVAADLKPGTYTFFCTVPGHRQAGMQGTLTVK
jgi:plastocyanin